MMRLPVKVAAIFGACLLAMAAAAAEEPSLVGTWVLQDLSGRDAPGGIWTKDSFKSAELTIDEHDGAVFSGVMRWTLAKDGAVPAEEALLGVRDFDDTYVVVEHPDVMIRRFKLSGDDTIHEVAFKSGPHAAVRRSVWVRQ